jgi:chorismate mutase / prephenate dehydratase
MTAAKPDTLLETIRREIDAIDDALLDLVVRRFDATAKVRATKLNDGTIAASPLRPAREASMLRRLIARADGKISPELLVRLWRVILSTSTQSQAPVVLHIDAELTEDTSLRVCLAEHFCGMAIASHSDLAEAFSAITHRKGDLVITRTTAPWAEHFADVSRSGARLIGCLPVIDGGLIPELLIFGHAEPLPSGADDTILISRGNTISDPGWQVHSGIWTVTCLPGFLTDNEAFASSHGQGEKLIAGRYPRPIEVTS